MAKGFFRERKHYKSYEIARKLGLTAEETAELLGTLKRYGIVKAIKTSKAEFTELSNEDLVIADDEKNSADVEYIFDFVGVVMLGEQVLLCYPKYISSTDQTMRQLKQALKVIQKYNEKEQLIYLYNGEDDNRIFNRLAVALHLLTDYYRCGLYTNRREVTERNGDGEILWDRTIDETFALIRGNRPYYTEILTNHTVDDETDYFKRLHECVLTRCSASLKEAGILELFDIAETELSGEELDDFGDTGYIRYRLEREMQTQFVTRRQVLLKTIYTYIVNERANREDQAFSLYGTNNFQAVWEKVCADNFGNMLDEKLGRLPGGLAASYADKKNVMLRSLIDAPVWYRNCPPRAEDKGDALRPDLICIYPISSDKSQLLLTGDARQGARADGGGQLARAAYCFGIFDAKYYLIDFKEKRDGWSVSGQPGVGDVTKQYLYQLAFDAFITAQGYGCVTNTFLCPAEETEWDYGCAEMKMLHTIGNKTLENIKITKLCAEEMYEIWLRGEKITGIGNVGEIITGIGKA